MQLEKDISYCSESKGGTLGVTEKWYPWWETGGWKFSVGDQSLVPWVENRGMELRVGYRSVVPWFFGEPGLDLRGTERAL